MPKENVLPVKVDPFRLADHAVSLKGILLVKNMQRLVTSLHSTEGDVTVSMDYGIDGQGIRFLHAHFAVDLVLQCQRCLGPFLYYIADNFLVGIVHTEEEAKQLPENYIGLVAKEGSLIIQDVLEDELILSLPIVPMHDPKDCKVKLPLAAGSEDTAEITKGENPFKVIELLCSKRTSKK